ncbi:cytochrome c peroxidase [Haloferula luteola]|uniref:Cytochrome c peroxidase n=1 Tax=Haloferula luteola TaxID=595692 RepID=A0A840V9N2_9BACT|nr:cytochrome c peroxidase [Haloferula luteola]MBB5353786.1 cytochrome c peroxidase [Haloferula luteola]
MKALSTLFLIAATHAQDAPVIDLTHPFPYSSQEVPDYITRDNTPPDNPITDLGATLGRVLFYDSRLSRNQTVSCASCHQQEHGFSDPDTASMGVAGFSGRHSMRLINARFSDETRFFWDERADSVEDQATQPIQDHIEMGFSGTDGDPGFSDLVDRLSSIEVYQVLFAGVFGDPEVTEERIGKSLAQFVRSIQSFDSRYDEGRDLTGADGPPFPNFTMEENDGKILFLRPPAQGGAGCAGCHVPPEFSIDPASRNNGVVSSLSGGTDTTNTRAPSLRDLVDANGQPHGGFMHDASFATLEEVIEHYNAVPAVVTNLDARLIRPGNLPQELGLDATEVASLEAFLKTLTGRRVYTDQQWSDPFDKEGTLQTIVLPTESIECGREIRQGVRFTTLTAQAVPNVTYGLQASTDLTHWATVSVTADAEGWLSLDIPDELGIEARYFRFIYPVPSE